MALNINGTTGISGVEGSVSAPVLTGTDSNCGISFPAADTIKFSTGGVERMSITNSGVTGVSGGKILQVVSTTKTAAVSNATAAASLWSYNDASLRATITASSASNFFKITGQIVIGSNGLAVSAILYDNGSAVTTAKALGDASGSTRRSLVGTDNGSTEGVATIPVHAYISCADTNEHKFHYVFYHNGGGTNDIFLNRPYSATDSNKRGRYISNITVEEVAA